MAVQQCQLTAVIPVDNLKAICKMAVRKDNFVTWPKRTTLKAGIRGVGTTFRVITTSNAGLTIVIRIKDLLAILGVFQHIK